MSANIVGKRKRKADEFADGQEHLLHHLAGIRPFSFTSLLTAPDDDNIDYGYGDFITQQQHLDQIVSLHGENLRQAMWEMLGKHKGNLQREADIRAAKKLKEKEQEVQAKLVNRGKLEWKVEHYMAEVDRLTIKVKHLEQETASLRFAVHRARRYAEALQEDAESSFEDPDRVDPVQLDCRACARQMATMMMWPCRHVCVCTQCDAVTRACPVCFSIKTISVEVRLPLN